MTDYKKLVKSLRCKRDDCEGCELAFFDKDEGWMCQYAAKDDDAADAIENLERQVENLKQENRFLKSMQRGIAESMELDSLGKMVARAMREVKDGD